MKTRWVHPKGLFPMKNFKRQLDLNQVLFVNTIPIASAPEPPVMFLHTSSQLVTILRLLLTRISNICQ